MTAMFKYQKDGLNEGEDLAEKVSVIFEQAASLLVHCRRL